MPPGEVRTLRVVEPSRSTGSRPWVSRPRSSTCTRAAPFSIPVVMVSGPAGAGKSVLARQVLDADDRHRLELPLAPRLDEPAALVRAVVEALETVGLAAPNLHSSITAAEPAFSTIVLPALARLVSSRTTPYVLLVDDLHVLRDRATHEVIRTLCDATPVGSRVLLLSRDATPPWLSRARAEGCLVEISEHHLRFTVSEADELLQGMAVTPAADVAAIVEDTEGWAVAIYLTALARQHGDAPPSFAAASESRSSRFIADYIRTEVLPPLDPELQTFLLRSAILDA